MRKLLAIIFLIGCILTSGILTAQPNRFGVPIITNYEHYITQGSEQNWCITQDHRGVMYFGNVEGVLEYDGVEWRNIPVSNDPIVRSLVTGEDGVVYVGAEAEFGRLEPDRFGRMRYRSLSDTINREIHPFFSVWKTHYDRGRVYFCSRTNIFIYDPEADSLAVLKVPDNALFAFFIDHTLYVGDFGQGLMKYHRDEFVPVEGGEFFAEMNISSLVKFDDTRLLAGTYQNGLFLYNTGSGMVEADFLDPEINEYMKENVIIHMLPLQHTIAVGTQYGGLVILDRTGIAREIITETEGLIEQTITYVYSDRRASGSGPLWVTNFEGVSKLETNNPFRVFTEESGFDGLITGIRELNGRLFVSTLSGLYYKVSDATGTGFVPVSEIRDQIWHMHVFTPSPGKELLLVSTMEETYVIDEAMKISTIREGITDPPGNNRDMLNYAGMCLAQDPGKADVVYTGRWDIVGIRYMNGGWKEILRIRDLPEERIETLGMDKYGYLWLSTPRRVVRIDITLSQEASMKFFFKENGLPTDERNKVFIDPDTEEILLGTLDGFYRYNYFRDTLFRDTLFNQVLPPGRNLIHAFHKDVEGDYWYSFENEETGWSELVARREGDRMEVIRDKSFQRLPDASVDVFFSDDEGAVWFSKANELYHFDKSYSRDDTLRFHALIRSVVIDNDSVLYYGTNFKKNKDGFTMHPVQTEDAQPEIGYRYNNIAFQWSAPFFEQEENLNFSYRLHGFDDQWSSWDDVVYRDFTNLPHGDYTMQVKAMNVYGDVSLPAVYSFTILKPWYATIVAIIAYILLAGLIVYIIIRLYTRRLKQENIRLEGIIQERTAEIRRQKEELTDSIEYASRIQRALLPPDKLMDEHNIEHFILFRPRDIVSGDFYWMGSKNGKILIVAADCTGHGVPGAFMSMLGMTFLDEIVIKSEITSTDQILELLRDHVITSLKQSGKNMEESTKDGMDLAMIAIDQETREIQFSGAYNPIYLVRKLKRSEKYRLSKGESLDLPRGSIHDDTNLLLQIRADQMPIGISEKSLPFTSTSFRDEGFAIYMFSDGFLDQFGGPQGKKFMSRNFKKLILELQHLPVPEQGPAMEKVLLNWMGEISQIDDILVMGLRINQN